MIILSPSKRQAVFSANNSVNKLGDFKKVMVLVEALSAHTPTSLQKILGVSPAIAEKAYQSYQTLSKQPSEAMAAIDLYKGDVYGSLDVESMTDKERAYLNKELKIISPLYGLIEPQNGIWPYRLEMTTKVPSIGSLPLYWQSMQDTVDALAPTYIFNLASQEYASCIKAPKRTQWIDIVFLDKTPSGKYQTVAVKAKRMRGILLRYMAENIIEKPEQLDAFESHGYYFDETGSTPSKLVYKKG